MALSRYVATLIVSLFLFAAPAAAQSTYVAVVVGLAGDPEHGELFQRWATTLVDASAKMGIPSDHVVFLSEKPEADAKRISGKSTKEEIVKAFAKLGQAAPDDVVFVFLIGHGTFDGKVAKFNLPGPDMTPEDFAPLMKGLKSQHVGTREHVERKRAVRRDACGAGPHDRRRHAERRRTVRDALRWVLRRRAGGE